MRARYFLAAFAASSPLFLGGCAIPPAIMIASSIVTGISYVASGKSIEDHALSAIANQDCAVHHILQEKAICSDYPAPEIAMNTARDVAAAGPASSQSERRDRD